MQLVEARTGVVDVLEDTHREDRVEARIVERQEHRVARGQRLELRERRQRAGDHAVHLGVPVDRRDADAAIAQHPRELAVAAAPVEHAVMPGTGDPVGGRLVLGHLRTRAKVDVAAVDAALVGAGDRRRLVRPRALGHRDSSSRSARVMSRMSSSKVVVGRQPRSRSALPGSPISWSTSAGRTKAGSIST